MHKRRTMALALVFMLVLAYAAGAYAAADKADTAYLRDLKKVEDYLRKNYDEPNLGEKAYDYIRKNLRDMDLERLKANLRSFLRCSAAVPLPNMLEAYTKEIRGDYKSIYERAKDYGLRPEEAADENGYNRAVLGAQMAAMPVTSNGYTPEMEWWIEHCGGLCAGGRPVSGTCVQYRYP